MASIEESTYKKLVAGLADQRLSPAILAMKITREGRAVNEAMLGMLINYIIIMADKPLIPFTLVEVQQQCKLLKISLEELGLTGKVLKEPVNNYEFLQV